jgi:hypothetical protein
LLVLIKELNMEKRVRVMPKLSAAYMLRRRSRRRRRRQGVERIGSFVMRRPV